MVSSGCPASSRQAPATPPATKFLSGETLASCPILSPAWPEHTAGPRSTSHRPDSPLNRRRPLSLSLSLAVRHLTCLSLCLYNCLSVCHTYSMSWTLSPADTDTQTDRVTLLSCNLNTLHAKLQSSNTSAACCYFVFLI